MVAEGAEDAEGVSVETPDSVNFLKASAEARRQLQDLMVAAEGAERLSSESLDSAKLPKVSVENGDSGRLTKTEIAKLPKASAEALDSVRPARTCTLSATVGYRGGAFAGYAKQPGQLTVQGELEHALGLIFRKPVETTCAGRTDAGVHARGQVVSFDLTDADLQGRELRRIRRSLNALTHDDIVVYDVALREPGFSARFDAVSREYHYHVVAGDVPPVFMRDFAWHVPGDLDVDAMQRAASCLVGEHDFKSFCKAVSAVGKPTHRYLSEVSFSREVVLGENVITMKIVGNAFLHSMVRSIMGSLVMVGRGQRDASWIAEALAACDRKAAGECAPACGLVFWNVDYDGPRLYMPDIETSADKKEVGDAR